MRWLAFVFLVAIGFRTRFKNDQKQNRKEIPKLNQKPKPERQPSKTNPKTRSCIKNRFPGNVYESFLAMKKTTYNDRPPFFSPGAARVGGNPNVVAAFPALPLHYKKLFQSIMNITV